MPKRTLEDRIDAGEFVAYIDNQAFNYRRVDIAGLIRRLASLDQPLSLTATGFTGRHGEVDRRSRASALSALKRAIERETGVKLTFTGASYSETSGFMHATYASYTIEVKLCPRG